MTRELQKYVDSVEESLKNSSGTFREIYDIMFSVPANVMCETNDGFRIHRQTYGEMKARIEKCASALRENIGGAGEYVALDMENCPEWIVAFWAILMSGNKPYLVNCRHPLALSEGIVKSLGCRYALNKAGKGDLPLEYLSVTELEKRGEDIGALSTEYFDNEIALSTSATSLKEVVCFYTGLEIKNQLYNVKYILKECDPVSQHYNGSLKQLAFLPFYHIFGLIAVFFWFALFTRTFVFLNDYSGDTIMKTCRKHEVTHVFAVPMLWHEIERQLDREVSKYDEKTQKKLAKGRKIATAIQNIAPISGAKFSRKLLKQVTGKLFGPTVCFCISGGSFLRPSALDLFNSLGYSLHDGYGMSEIGITSVDLRLKPKNLAKASVGKPLPSVEYRINDRGTLEVKGSSICRRMMVDGEVREVPEWFDTGDVMEKDDEGYYYIKGRIADTVIGDNGENINPDVLEERFTLPAAERFSVLGLDSGDGVTKRLSMIVQVSPYLSVQKRFLLAEEIYRVNGTFPSVASISDFYFTEDEIAPKTAVKVGRQYLIRALENGKVKLTRFSDVKALAAKTAEGKEDAFDVNSPVAKKVREIIAENIGAEPEDIGPDAHIMQDLGASSMQYFSIAKAIGEEFGIDAIDENAKSCSTLRAISEYIERNL